MYVCAYVRTCVSIRTVHIRIYTYIHTYVHVHTRIVHMCAHTYNSFSEHTYIICSWWINKFGRLNGYSLVLVRTLYCYWEIVAD